MSLFKTLTGESWRRAIQMGRTETNEAAKKIFAALRSMKKILILQSSAPDAPQWVRECMHSVELWCEQKGYQYAHFGDSIFSFVPEFTHPFTKVQRSDLARLRLMEAHLCLNHYDAVYWLDADFLIWNIYEFDLPRPVPGSVVCAREAYHTPVSITLLLNNSVMGFCRREDAHTLAVLTENALNPWKDKTVTPPHIVAGPLVISRLRFPLRRIIAKQAGCFSDFTISRILGPWLAGRAHLWWLSLASGATLKGANLCSSRKVDGATMEALVADMIHGEDRELGGWKYASPIYRGYLRVSAIPFRARCWLQTRWLRIREAPIPAS